jgi:hypothetical protein
MENITLDEIARQENTDKCSLYHGYANKYDFYLSSIKNSPVNILEIGILKGSSLKMWQRYFDKAKIYAVDIDESCKVHENERVKVLIGSQADEEFLTSNLSGVEFDVIIDDGSHIPSHQIKSFETLFPLLKPGGLYIIEDVHTSYSPAPIFADEKINFVDYLKNKVDDLQLNGKDAIDYSYGDKKNHLNAVGWEKLETYNYYEKWIEFIHFYKSICFIKKEVW